MKTRLWLLALIAGLVAACGGDPIADGVGIEPQDPELVAEGAVLYEDKCAECHGTDLRGTERGPSHLSEVYVPGHHSDGAFQLAVTAGSPQHHWDFGPMPPIDGLSQADVAAIVAFVRERQRTEGFESYPP